MSSRSGTQELSSDECMQRLGDHHVGRLGFCEDDGPVILPVNYTISEGEILIRTGTGSKAATAARQDRVAFQIDDLTPGTPAAQWSVLVRGRARIASFDELPVLLAEGVLPAAGTLDREFMVLVTMDEISGITLVANEIA